MNRGHIIKRPSPMFKNEWIYDAYIKRPDGSIINQRNTLDTASEALEFLLSYKIPMRHIKTTTEEETQ